MFSFYLSSGLSIIYVHKAFLKYNQVQKIIFVSYIMNIPSSSWLFIIGSWKCYEESFTILYPEKIYLWPILWPDIDHCVLTAQFTILLRQLKESEIWWYQTLLCSLFSPYLFFHSPLFKLNLPLPHIHFN